MIKNRRMLRRLLKALFYLAILLITVAVVFPLVWMLLTSLKSRDQIFVYPPKFLGFTPTLKNYKEVWVELGFSRLFFNTTYVAVWTTVISIAVGTLAGYSLARLRYPGKEAISAAILATYMFPGVLLLIPIFVMMAKMRLVNTYTGLIIASITFSLPFCIWMLRAYFMTLPQDLEDAARIDGCTRLGALWRIVFPLSAPGIAATSVFAFMGAWGNYMFALLLLSTESKKTLPPAIGTFITRETISWHLLMAGGMISTIPVLIFFLLVQKYLVQGLTLGAGK
jgi:multiple sugar transport system permease protein